jgi:ubiquinone/menaquinone biosynthesis C-methylase UbiE
MAMAEQPSMDERGASGPLPGEEPIMDQSERHDGDGAYGSDAAAEGWSHGADERVQFLSPITEMMLDMAGLEPGRRVIDVAAGTGEQTLLAARRVGTTGRVVATDVSAAMLGVAAEAAHQAGLTNVETLVMDARQLDLEGDSFDAAISRLALMLIPERAKALAEIHRVLRPGGRLAAIVISSAETNPLVNLPMEVARRYAGLPSEVLMDPGFFALGDPRLLQRAYEQAGFRDVAVHVVPHRRRFPSLAAALQNRRDSLPEIGTLTTGLSHASREAMWDEIEACIRRFDGPDGFMADGEMLLGVGTR